MATDSTIPTSPTRTPWYRRTLWIVVLLIFIPPVGAVLAWLFRPAWPIALRVILAVWGVIGAFYYVGCMGTPAQPATTAQATPGTQQAAPAAKPTTMPTLAPTSRPTAPPTATPVPPEPTASVPNFGEGTKLVGVDIQPGTYRSKNAGAGCYWARVSGMGGTTAEIIANDNAFGPAVVTIEATDTGFISRRCAQWTQDLAPLRADANAAFGDGTMIVGVDIAPGTWRAESAAGCYWARTRGFSGKTDQIIANDNARGPAVVQIAATDKGFTSRRCGDWTKVS